MVIVVHSDTRCNLKKRYHRNVSEGPAASIFRVEVHPELKSRLIPDVVNFVTFNKEGGCRIHLLAREIHLFVVHKVCYVLSGYMNKPPTRYHMLEESLKILRSFCP